MESVQEAHEKVFEIDIRYLYFTRLRDVSLFHIDRDISILKRDISNFNRFFISIIEIYLFINLEKLSKISLFHNNSIYPETEISIYFSRDISILLMNGNFSPL